MQQPREAAIARGEGLEPHGRRYLGCTGVLYETEIIRLWVHSHGRRDSRGGNHDTSEPEA